VCGRPRPVRPSLRDGRSECRWLFHGLGAPCHHPGRAPDGRGQRGNGGDDGVDRDGEPVSFLVVAGGRAGGEGGRREGTGGRGTGDGGIDGTRHVAPVSQASKEGSPQTESLTRTYRPSLSHTAASWSRSMTTSLWLFTTRANR